MWYSANLQNTLTKIQHRLLRTALTKVYVKAGKGFAQQGWIQKEGVQ